jgi:hypothetical protein
MVLRLPLAHIPSYFADHRHRRHDIDAIDLGQVRTGRAKQLFPQVKLGIAFLLLAPSLSRLFRQSGPPGSDPLVARGTVPAADRTPCSVSGKERNRRKKRGLPKPIVERYMRTLDF